MDAYCKEKHKYQITNSSITMEKTHKYSNGEITILWKPDKCIHAGICVKMLPKVYNPKARPWITAEGATTQELIAQIEKCPSGALSYQIDK